MSPMEKGVVGDHEKIMPYFFDSEVARLILGYLKENDFGNTFKQFLIECPYLAEYSKALRYGTLPPTRSLGYSLEEMLNLFGHAKDAGSLLQPPGMSGRNCGAFGAEAVLEPGVYCSCGCSHCCSKERDGLPSFSVMDVDSPVPLSSPDLVTSTGSSVPHVPHQKLTSLRSPHLNTTGHNLDMPNLEQILEPHSANVFRSDNEDISRTSKQQMMPINRVVNQKVVVHDDEIRHSDVQNVQGQNDHLSPCKLKEQQFDNLMTTKAGVGSSFNSNSREKLLLGKATQEKDACKTLRFRRHSFQACLMPRSCEKKVLVNHSSHHTHLSSKDKDKFSELESSMGMSAVSSVPADMLTSHSLPALWPESSYELSKRSLFNSLTSQSSSLDNVLRKGIIRRDMGRTKTVISVTSDHAPYIPDHCKKVPTRRIAPTEVSYDTPSPLQDYPSSPINFAIDMQTSAPSTPATPSSLIVTEDPHCSTSRVSSVKLPTSSAIQSLESAGVSLPPSPSQRKPRRVQFQTLRIGKPDKPPVFVSIDNEPASVSSSSDFHPAFQSEESLEAFRQLRNLISTQSKPQPCQEISSTKPTHSHSKCGCRDRDGCKHRKSRGNKEKALHDGTLINPQNDKDKSKKCHDRKNSDVQQMTNSITTETICVLSESSVEKGVNLHCPLISKSNNVIGLMESEKLSEEEKRANAIGVQCEKHASFPDININSKSPQLNITPLTGNGCHHPKHQQEQVISSTSEDPTGTRVPKTTSAQNLDYFSSAASTVCLSSYVNITASTLTQPHTVAVYPTPITSGTYTSLLNAPLTESNFATFLESEQTQSLTGLISESFALANETTPRDYTTLEPVVMSGEKPSYSEVNHHVEQDAISSCRLPNDNLESLNQFEPLFQNKYDAQRPSPLKLKDSLVTPEKNDPMIAGSRATCGSHQEKSDCKIKNSKTILRAAGLNQNYCPILPKLDANEVKPCSYDPIVPRPDNVERLESCRVLTVEHPGGGVSYILPPGESLPSKIGIPTTRAILPSTPTATTTVLNSEIKLHAGKIESKKCRLLNESSKKNTKSELIDSQKFIIEGFIGKKKRHSWETLEQSLFDQEESDPALELSVLKNRKMSKGLKKPSKKKERILSDKNKSKAENKGRSEKSKSELSDRIKGNEDSYPLPTSPNHIYDSEDESIVDVISCPVDESVVGDVKCSEQKLENVSNFSSQTEQKVKRKRDTSYENIHKGRISNKSSKIANRHRLKVNVVNDGTEEIIGAARQQSDIFHCQLNQDVSRELDNGQVSNSSLMSNSFGPCSVETDKSCRVCGDEQYVYCGVCKGCKSFFRSNYNKTFMCKSEGDFKDQCPVNKQPGQCKSCRFKKCIEFITIPEKSNQECSVCGDVGTINIGVFYGVTSCMDCREFFKRNLQKTPDQLFTCKAKGDCEVKDCLACKYKKCLSAGMTTQRDQSYSAEKVDSMKKKKRACSNDKQYAPLPKKQKHCFTDDLSLGKSDTVLVSLDLPSSRNTISIKGKCASGPKERCSPRRVKNKVVTIVNKMNEGEDILSFEIKNPSTPHKTGKTFKRNTDSSLQKDLETQNSGGKSLTASKTMVEKQNSEKTNESCTPVSKQQTKPMHLNDKRLRKNEGLKSKRSSSSCQQKQNTPESLIAPLLNPQEKKSDESEIIEHPQTKCFKSLPSAVQESKSDEDSLANQHLDRKAISDFETAAAVRALKLSMGEDSRTASRPWDPQLSSSETINIAKDISRSKNSYTVPSNDFQDSCQSFKFNTRLGGSPVKNLPPKKRLSCEFFPTLSSQGTKSCLSFSQGPSDFRDVRFESDQPTIMTPISSPSRISPDYQCKTSSSYIESDHSKDRDERGVKTLFLTSDVSTQVPTSQSSHVSGIASSSQPIPSLLQSDKEHCINTDMGNTSQNSSNETAVISQNRKRKKMSPEQKRKLLKKLHKKKE